MVAWDRHRLLPSVCPACGRQGVHAVDLPWLSSSDVPRADSARLERQLHYCDLCFEARERDRTQQWAWLLALGVFAVCSGTAVAVLGGRWSRHLEWLSLVLLWSALIGAQLRWRRPRRRFEGEGTLLTSEPHVNQASHTRRNDERDHAASSRVPGTDSSQGTRQRSGESGPCSAPVLVVTESRHLLACLLESGAAPRSLPAEWQQREPSPLPVRLISLQRWLPLPLALGSWVAILALGGADLRVVNGGQETLNVLVDGRLATQVLPARFETPHFGARLALPAGWHEVTLIGGDGVVVSQERVRIWPSSQWFAGRLPKGQCLFVDEWDTGSGGARRALDFDGALVELPIAIDAWFQPLTPTSSEPPLLEEAARWSAASGVRRALRLLPCTP